MATEILAVDDTQADSDDQVVASGNSLTVCLKNAVGLDVSPYAEVSIQLKDDDGLYFTVATLTGQYPATVITGAGTYRFSRKEGAACGVFSG